MSVNLPASLKPTLNQMADRLAECVAGHSFAPARGSASFRGASILNADCMAVMSELADNAYDLAICDPPYGIGINMNQGRRKGDVIKHARKKWDANPPAAEYWKELTRVSRNQIVWGANNFEWIPAHNGWVVWDKDITGDVGFSRAELAYNSGINIVDMVRIRAQSGAETYTNKIHPTQKPVKLYSWQLGKYAQPGWRILDTHMGSGSSVTAALELGFEILACEIDAEYFATAVERIGRYESQGTFAMKPNAPDQRPERENL